MRLLTRIRSKRGYEGSPIQSATSSISYNLQPGALHDRGWHGGASKRVRSDSDYSAQMSYTPQLGPNSAMYQYPVQPYASHTPQGPPTSQPEPYGGMLGQNHTQIAPVSECREGSQDGMSSERSNARARPRKRVVLHHTHTWAQLCWNWLTRSARPSRVTIHTSVQLVRVHSQPVIIRLQHKHILSLNTTHHHDGQIRALVSNFKYPHL